MPSILDPEYYVRAENAIDGLLDRVMSADEAYELLRDTWQYAPRRIVRDVWREAKRAAEYVPIIDRLPADYHVPSEWMRESWHTMDAEFYYKLRISGTLKETGEEFTQFITVVSDDSLSLMDIYNTTAAMAAEYGVGLIIPDFQIDFMEARRPAG